MLNFQVIIDSSETKTFYAGCKLTGAVILKNEKEIKARKIDLKIIGRAQTRFRSGRSYLSCQEDYINEYAILWESDDGSNELPANKYTFPFNVKIPENAPASLNEKFGDVKYFIESTIEVPFGLNKKAVCDFYVLEIIDLNIDRRLSLQVFADTAKNVMCFPSCSSYPIYLAVSIPKTGYICGEEILVSVCIERRASPKIKYLEIGFIEDTVIFGNDAGFPTLPKKDSLKMKCSIMKYMQQFKPPFNDIYAITVPQMLPNYIRCYIIKITYLLFVKIRTDSVLSSNGPEVKIPITIGTVKIGKEDTFDDDIVTFSLQFIKERMLNPNQKSMIEIFVNLRKSRRIFLNVCF